MPTTITLKNIPDELYERLKAAAKAHRRSLNNEVIVCLESALTPHRRIGREDRVERVREIRDSLQTKWFDHDLVDEFKREGRE